MHIRANSLFYLAVCATLTMSIAGKAAEPVSVHGTITSAAGPLEGAYVGARADGSTVTKYVMTDGKGEFLLRGLARGTYTLLTRIPGFRNVIRPGIRVESGKEVQSDFLVETERDFLRLVEQASNSELLESLPLTDMEKIGTRQPLQ